MKNMIVGAVCVGIFLAASTGAQAHCDTMSGPVVKDAKLALEKSDVTPVLKWVQKENESAVRAAFESALVERTQSSGSQEKADMKFFETLTRIHREGEGAPFTGMKPAEALDPMEAEADRALEAGSVDALTAEMSHHLANGVHERFARALDKKKAMNDSVEAGREYVEAYVEYLHYVEGIHSAVKGQNEHHAEEGGAGE